MNTLSYRTSVKHRWLILFYLCWLFVSPAAALEVHQNISGPFASPAEVAETCVDCHREQAIALLQSSHWTWVRQRIINGKSTLFGKKDSLTGFAIDVASNPERCMGCHVSVTRPEVNFDKPTPESVDCLVCHDTTGMYRRMNRGEREGGQSESLERMAREAGIPSPANCLSCHFTDCGLPVTERSGAFSSIPVQIPSDVHLTGLQPSLKCQDCHLKRNSHNLSRTMLNGTSTAATPGCISCHADPQHDSPVLNQHTAAIACQTCHITGTASRTPRLISWNWLMTGKANRLYYSTAGTRVLARDENGITLARELEPVYMWDNGGDIIYTRGERIRPQEMTYLQHPDEKNTDAKITPFRVVYGTQLYDTKYRYLISPLLQATGAAFFAGSEWETIARQGMEAIILPFSGQYGFAPTAAYRRINHGVVPKGEALGCLDCHGSRAILPWQELGYSSDPWDAVAEMKYMESDEEKNSVNAPPIGGYNSLLNR